MLDETTHQVIISRKEKPNSYEIGKAGNRFTLCFDTPEDLKAQIDKLKELGYLQDEQRKNKSNRRRNEKRTKRRSYRV